MPEDELELENVTQEIRAELFLAAFRNAPTKEALVQQRREPLRERQQFLQSQGTLAIRIFEVLTQRSRIGVSPSAFYTYSMLGDSNRNIVLILKPDRLFAVFL